MKDELDRTAEDVRAITELMAREIEAFWTRDFDAWAACYLQSDRLHSTMMSHELGLDIRRGWDAAVAHVRPHFETPFTHVPTWNKVVERVEVVGDCAWLTCRSTSDSDECMMDESHETCVLERHDGDWKIVCSNIMGVRAFTNRDRRIALDAEGRVIGIGQRAEDFIREHPALTIRSDRLHATDAALERDLQAAIVRAGTLHGHFEQAAYVEMEGQQFAHPLVLEREDGSGHEVLVLTVCDQLTYLEFGLSQGVTTRVDSSALAFDLSDSQHRVALGVVAGESLPEIAQGMGISPSTAKTHLQRVYQKTGTNTMTALVRTLLSVS